MAKAKTTTTTTTVATSAGDWGQESTKKYSKLAGKVDYDHEAAEQLVEAILNHLGLTERATLDNKLVPAPKKTKKEDK